MKKLCWLTFASVSAGATLCSSLHMSDQPSRLVEVQNIGAPSQGLSKTRLHTSLASYRILKTTIQGGKKVQDSDAHILRPSLKFWQFCLAAHIGKRDNMTCATHDPKCDSVGRTFLPDRLA